MTPRMPYPGLRAFRRDEADVFFGRDDCIDDMVDKLAATRFLAVLGASGSGKSSLVRTGMLHALALGFNVRAGSRWMIAEMHPGSDPVHALAGGLLAAKDAPYTADDVDLLADSLRRAPSAIVQWCLAGHLPPGANLLIMADQFEELFRYGDYGARDTAEAFVNLLLESARAPEVPISIVITMRSEFLAACTLFDGLAERINAGLYLTPRMTREACELAIVGPAMVCGFTVEQALVNDLINDMTAFAPWEEGGTAGQIERLSRRADQLPLMQHVLNLMWLQADARGGPIELTKAAYDALGGLKGALDEHGAAIIARLGPGAEAATESVFRALVSGSSAALAVRRPTTLDEIAALAHADRAMIERVIEAFRAPDCNFLQPPATVPLRGDTVIDLSHESLIRQWSLLADWTAKEARSAESWRRLNAATAREASGEGGLLQGRDLAAVSEWWDAERPGPVWQARFGGDHAAAAAFLARSRAAQDAIEAARLDAEAREKRGLRRRAAIYAGLALLSTSSTVVALWEWRAASISSAGQLAAERQKLGFETIAKTEAIRAARIAEHATAVAKDALAKERERARAVAQAEEAEHQRLIAQRTSLAMRVQALAERRGRLAAEEQRETATVEKERYRDLSKSLGKSATPEQIASLSDADRALLKGLNEDEKEIVASIKQANAGVASGSSVVDGALKPERGQAADASGRLPRALVMQIREDLARRIEPDIIARTREQEDRLRADYETQRVAARRSNATAEQLAAFGASADNYARLTNSLDDAAPVRAIIGEMEDVARRLQRLGVSTAARDLELRAAFLRWRASATSNPAESDAMGAAMFKRVDISAAATDRTEAERALIVRARILQAVNRPAGDPDRPAVLDAACVEAESAANAYPADSFLRRQLARCRWLQAASSKDRADALFGDANDALRAALRERPDDQVLNFTLFEGLARHANYIGWGPKARGFAMRQEALDALNRAIADRPIESEVIGLAIADPMGWVFAWEFADREQELAMFLKAERAVASAATAFPRSDIGYQLADLRRRIAEVLLRSPPAEKEGYDYYRLADAGYDATGRLAKRAKAIAARPAPPFTEALTDMCVVKLKLARNAAIDGKIDNAIAAFRAGAAQCEAGLAAYPFDIYLRLPFIAAQADIGAALHANDRIVEAIPYIDYASKWGEASSSRLLATLYEEGRGVVADRQRASQLRTLAERQGTMKRFTVPVSDGTNSYPLSVYVREWPAQYYAEAPQGLGLTGIRDQATWAKEARGLDIAPDVIASFDKLQKIAADNNVSFPELAAYALGAAQRSEKDGTDGATADQARPIVAALRADRFVRAPGLASDKTGVMLNGFDPVGFFDNGKALPSDARYFTLWRGAIWLFANDANRRKFLANPERYLPAYGGYCAACAALGHVTAPDPKQFVVHDGRLYLFSSEETRQRWLDETAGYLRRADEQWAKKQPGDFPPVDPTKLGNFISDELAKAPGTKTN